MRLYHRICFTIGCLILSGCGSNTTEASSSVDEIKKPTPIVKPSVKIDVPQRCTKIAPLVVDFENPSWALAQLDQESNCNFFAVSPVGAEGVAQIMPGNLEWLETDVCRGLGKANPYNPYWAVPCYEKFMAWFTVDLFDSYCLNKFVDSMRYNGGYYVIWEIRATVDGTLHSAEKICGTRLPNGRKRSKASCKENYEYPVKISDRQPNFISLGGKQC